jgi:hypothetical protein
MLQIGIELFLTLISKKSYFMSLSILNHEFRHFLSTCARRRFYTIVHFAVCLVAGAGVTEVNKE